MKQITKRLLGGEDLREGIEKLLAANNVKAGIIGSVVGSLSKATLRLGGAKDIKTLEGNLEIVGGTGTVSINGSHIHISVADNAGNVSGGHLQNGCVVRTTVELVILIFEDTEYKREMDQKTGYPELTIR